MSKIRVKVSDFEGSYLYLNASHDISVSKRKCLKFAKSIGLPLLKAASPTNKHAIALATYKAQAIKCAIDFNQAYLNRPVEYQNMDQSEKANISYWVGMVFSAIIADQLLNVTRLVHANAFSRLRLAKVDPKSRSLADLVGEDIKGKWHVFEAKARQNVPGPDDLTRWKKQARTVRSIDGIMPSTQSYCLACIGDTYSAELVDPSEDMKNVQPIKIEFEDNALIHGYYGPLVEWLSEKHTTTRRGDKKLIVKLAGYDPSDNEFLFWGLEENVLKTLQTNELPKRLEENEFEDTYIGTDGIVVITSDKPELG